MPGRRVAGNARLHRPDADRTTLTERHDISAGGPLRLTAGGCALLLFVSEECPTSAMALRRLGRMCPAWRQAGLTAIAVFEDPPEVAVRVTRRLGWAGEVASQDPPYETSRAYRLVSVPTAVLIDGDGLIASTVTGWDQEALVTLIGRASALLQSELPIPEAIEPLRKPGCSSKAAQTRVLIEGSDRS